MSDTMRSQFEGIKDVNFHQTKKVADLAVRQVIDLRPYTEQPKLSDEAVDDMFQIILDENYYASDDYLSIFSNSYSYDPRDEIK